MSAAKPDDFPKWERVACRVRRLPDGTIESRWFRLSDGVFVTAPEITK